MSTWPLHESVSSLHTIIYKAKWTMVLSTLETGAFTWTHAPWHVHVEMEPI